MGINKNEDKQIGKNDKKDNQKQIVEADFNNKKLIKKNK